MCSSLQNVSVHNTGKMVFPDAQNPAFWRTFNQNDPQKSHQCILHDTIEKNKKSLVNFLNSDVVLSKGVTGFSVANYS